MDFWNNIINTAMIGTDKKNIDAAELSADLQEAATIIQANEAIDREEKFLQITALAFNYRQAGVTPFHKEEIILQQCPPEEKSYCNAAAMQVLKDIQSEESIPLLKFWLQQCNAKDQLVQPELIPSLLAEGVQQKKLQTDIAACCGKRGDWLGGFNETWNFSQNQTAEQLWQTGTPEQRKAILKDTFAINPSLAREWLQQTWAQEDASTKTSFLEIFSTNISEADITFLESLSAEKSKKVKDEAIRLLKQIPASPVVQLYQQVLQQSVELKKEKALLGLTSKTILQFHLPAGFDEGIFKTGIEKLSNTKEFTDDEFIIFQLIQSVPPTFWEHQLAADAKTIIEQFQKDDIGKKMMPALVIAAANFKEAAWAIYLMQHSSIFYIELIPLLPLQEQEQYSNQFFEQFADNVIQYAVQRENEWSTALTKNIFRHLAKNPYNYTRSFFSQYIHLIPAPVVAELEKCTPPEEHLRTMWSNSSDYIIKLVSLKLQTLKAFND
jgi:Family of unknown function (DUF5691)